MYNQTMIYSFAKIMKEDPFKTSTTSYIYSKYKKKRYLKINE